MPGLPEGFECKASGGISVLTAGPRDGKPMLLLHGIGSNALSFARLMSELLDRYRLIAWDAPGYGASLPLDNDHPTASTYADAVAGLAAREELAPFTLVGHSLGCLMAARFAARHASRVERLVLISPALGYRTTPGAPLDKGVAGRLAALEAEGAAKFAAARGPRLVHDRANRPEIVAAVVEAMAAVRLPGYAHACHLLSTGDLLGDAPSLTMPTLVVCGDHDEVTPPDNCRRMYDALASAAPDLGHRFQLVSSAGHAIVQEQPAAVARLIASAAPRQGNA